MMSVIAVSLCIAFAYVSLATICWTTGLVDLQHDNVTFCCKCLFVTAVLKCLTGFVWSVSVHIAKDRETNTPRGFAFITFSSSTDCNKACSAMDGKVCYFMCCNQPLGQKID